MFLDFVIKGLIFSLIVKIFLDGYIAKLHQMVANFVKTYDEKKLTENQLTENELTENQLTENQCRSVINNNSIKHDNSYSISSKSSKSSSYDNKISNNDNISNEYIHENKKIASSDYDIEKVYSIKFNYISDHCPTDINVPGYIWLNSNNNTINIYYDNQIHEFPILNKSIIRQYMKRPIK